VEAWGERSLLPERQRWLEIAALAEPDGGRETAQALRSLIGEIVVTPGNKRGEVHAELRGELMGILKFTNIKENQRTTHIMPAVVAGLATTFTELITKAL